MATYAGSKRVKNPEKWDGRRHKGAAFLAGAMAGMGMTIAMLALILLGITPRSVANLVADRIAALAGPGITEFFIQTIGSLGKEFLFLTVLLGQVVAGGLLGLLLAFITGATRRRNVIWRNSFVISTAVWLFFVLAGLPLLDQGFMGVALGNDQISTLVISFLLFQLFGLMVGYAYLMLVPSGRRFHEDVTEEELQDLNEKQLNDLAATTQSDLQVSRRRFVGFVSGVFVLMVGAAIGTKAFGAPTTSQYRATLGVLRPDGTLEGEVTPTDNFYQVSKNAFNPKVDGAGWKLEINGLVDKPLTFNLDDISKMPRQTVYHTLTCISNPVGGDLIGNAKWSGVRLADLLQMAGVKQNVEKVVFTCADGYKDSITIDKALEPNTIFALEMNGAPLTQDHGYPGRMLIPNIYGMKNAKWVTSVTVIDTDFEGFWQKQGWDNVATIKTQSTIVSPVDQSMVKGGEKTTIRGEAFAGSRNIAKVEVSTDNGQTWVEAQVKPRLGPNAWTLWSLDWTPPADSGKTYILKVRAVEEGNKVQDPNEADPAPSGSSGYHTISVRTM
ncbi:MAG TPA: molybdopterin-dependent oxidoreductase [Chloroflexia bacterium]|nr:molybdopterin-dependent oxidoreductase [Chloroflexia bacterium]